jgi:hypothetical protein
MDRMALEPGRTAVIFVAMMPDRAIDFVISHRAAMAIAKKSRRSCEIMTQGKMRVQ